ncbi:MAG: carbon-nitrogen hydrolase family protein [Rhodospirillaceae bacterium]
MTGIFRVACLQMQSGNDLEANFSTLCTMTREAAAHGAQFVLSPEYALMMDGSGRTMRERALPADGGTVLRDLCALSRELHIWTLIGSLTLLTDDQRMVNRSYLVDANGDIVASYDKIHMFDCTLPDGKVIRESSAYRPGECAVIANTPWGPLGMSVCYDLRFPNLYRALAKAGAIFLTIPSSFQRQTGKVHWHTLVKARAIENACFVFAPAMCGEHPGNRSTYGHTLIVDPWGDILADGGEAPGIVYADIDPKRVLKVRSMIPSLEHDRPYRTPA